MKFELGSVWKTRDGHKARILCTDLKDTKSIVAAIFYPGADEMIEVYFSNGLFQKKNETSIDLIEPWTEPRPKFQAWMHQSGDGLSFMPEGKKVAIEGWIRAPWLDEK